MPTVQDLAGRAHTRIAYMLLIEGVSWALTDEHELAGSGWIGGGRELVLGLKVPDTLTFSTSLSNGMQSADDAATFGITDFAAYGARMIAHVADQEYVRVTQRLSAGGPLHPGDDPAPATLIDDDGLNAPLWGRFINHEAIGPAGERRRYQLFPGDPMPGYDHAAILSETSGDLAASAVFGAPTFLRGRQVALYRIFKDVTKRVGDVTDWPAWQEQYDSGYSLIWWGSVDEISAEGREWKLKCDGPSSWLRKELNANRPVEWSPVNATLKLLTTPGEREDLIAIECWYEPSYNFFFKYGASSKFDAVDDVMPASGGVSDYVNAIDARMQAVLSTAGPDITWTVDNHATAHLVLGSTTQVVVKIDDIPQPLSGHDECGVVTLTMHEKLWRLLGWDPEVQQGSTFSSKYEVEFVAEEMGAPSSGYWRAKFHTLPLGKSTAAEAQSKCDNNGATRIFESINDAGVNLLWSKAHQEIVVAGTDTPPYCEGQTNRPPSSYTFDHPGFTETCDRTGYFAFRAPYRVSLDDDPIDMVQIAKVSWVADTFEAGETFAGTGASRYAYIERWMDPRYFGIDRTRLTKAWAAANGALEYVPFAYLGYRADDAADRADLVLLRMLLSTGTAGWDGYEGEGATRTLGLNAHPDATIAEGSDVEIADLGLGIYHGLIDWKSFVKVASAMPGGASSPLNRCKHGFIGPFDSQELISRILQPRGWALGMRGGKYTLWDMAQELGLDDVEVTLSPTDFDSKDLPYVEQITLTPMTPYDKFAVTYGASLTGTCQAEQDLQVTGRATDPGARVRRSNAENNIDGQGMVPFELWKKEQGGPTTWHPDWTKRWKQISDWRARPHLLVTGLAVRPSKAKDLHVGTVVSLSSDWGPTRDGRYGIAGKVGRVVKVQRPLTLQGPSRVDILIQSGDPKTTRRFAPHAFVLDMVDTLEQRHDATTRTLFCSRDWMGAGEADNFDTKYFVEPPWSTFGGGKALVYGYQHNGRTWAKTFEFRAEAVGQDPTKCWVRYEAGTFSGRFFDRMYTYLLLAPYDAQPASWVKQIFAVNTRSDHMFGSVPTKGFKML